MPRLIAAELSPEERCLKVVRLDTNEEIAPVTALDTDEKWVEWLPPNPELEKPEAERTPGFHPKYRVHDGEDGHVEFWPERLTVDFDVIHKVTGEILHRIRR